MTATAMAGVIGGPISGALLEMDGIWGLAGWQWLFLLEGLPAVILGFMALRVFTDRPEQADWLPPADREWLSATMNAERAQRMQTGHANVLRSLGSGRVWLLTLVYLLNTSVTYGIFLWLPRMLQDTAGPGVSVSLYTAIPFVAALFGMVLIGRHSDKTAERKLHVAACAITASIGLFMAVAFHNHLYLLVLAFTICQVGQRSVMSVFWAIPPMLLGGTAAAAGIAFINAIGNLGGFFGPTMMGWLRDTTGGYSGGLLVLAGALVLEAVLVATLKLPAGKPVARNV
jgi:ACS family tartrate transporter-like MFS transporter